MENGRELEHWYIKSIVKMRSNYLNYNLRFYKIIYYFRKKVIEKST